MNFRLLLLTAEAQSKGLLAREHALSPHRQPPDPGEVGHAEQAHTVCKDVFADVSRTAQAVKGPVNMVNFGDFDGTLAVAEGLLPAEPQADDANPVSKVAPLLRHTASAYPRRIVSEL